MAGNDVNTLLLLHGEDLTDASQYARVLTNSGVIWENVTTASM